jgi:hypothetical protein
MFVVGYPLFSELQYFSNYLRMQASLRSGAGLHGILPQDFVERSDKEVRVGF